ncbi:MAG: helix-turn-helix domain-containing protein [Alphaproteobacteria bacterium]|nr:helix-turn-helix domain-containing protein [Alphaproteobacteria bacterium]QQS57626.1 MAG: helix-turn-helix domain-containing protein [Alphaproteobacteria bacterium]
MQISLSIEEARAATGLGRTKLYQLINSGELKARKIGKRTIILKEDLEDFLNNLQPYNSITSSIRP